jgi:hypothetical protein
MVQLQRILQNLLRRAKNWGSEQDDLLANLPDNPWTYPGCGVHAKASDIFSREYYLRGSGSDPAGADWNAEGLTAKP